MKYGIYTIGQLAQTSPDFLVLQFGKMGAVLWRFANGLDDSPVKAFDEHYNGNERILKALATASPPPGFKRPAGCQADPLYADRKGGDVVAGNRSLIV